MIIQEKEQTLIQRSLSSACATATAIGKKRYFCNVNNTCFNVRGRGFMISKVILMSVYHSKINVNATH